MPFIQVTCSGTDAPIRHTVSVDGADDVAADDELPPAAELPPAGEELLLALELQPVIASAAAATPAASTADLFLSPTAGTPSRWGEPSGQTCTVTLATKLTGNFPIR
jgi:hypothetical protein